MRYVVDIPDSLDSVLANKAFSLKISAQELVDRIVFGELASWDEEECLRREGYYTKHTYEVLPIVEEPLDVFNAAILLRYVKLNGDITVAEIVHKYKCDPKKVYPLAKQLIAKGYLKHAGTSDEPLRMVLTREGEKIVR